MGEVLNLRSPCVVVLAGPGAAGKSTWAAANFAPGCVVSSDRLRAQVGAGEDDIAATADAFVLLEEIVRRRIARKLTTVIDTLGLEAEQRRRWLGLARQHGLACVAVAFDTSPAQCRERNRARTKRIPAAALTAQLRTWTLVRDLLAGEGYDAVLTPRSVRVVPRSFLTANAAARRQREAPAGLRFGLHVGSFTYPGGARRTAASLREIAVAAEAAGFDAIYVMDHFRQIPQLGKSGATLDVLSEGRAVCGLGLAWFREEHIAYGWDFPAVRDRYALLEDALRLLPLLWGPGAPS